jgi:hypothetical protein
MLTSGDPCASQPCMNQGTCLPQNGGFRCVCPPGFTGTRCEIRDACQSNPCLNGGTCQPINGNGGYQCLCPAGFSGVRCEISKKTRYSLDSLKRRNLETVIKKKMMYYFRRCMYTESMLEWCYMYIEWFWRIQLPVSTWIHWSTM